jgi:DNA-binding LytR/AlgR family response regulator
MKSKESYRILVVDDEKSIAEMSAAMLTDLGYVVTGIAHTYDSAIAKLTSSKPDLIILDIDLKEEKSGIDLANYIKENLHMPFLYLTSFADIDTVKKAAKTTPEAYLIKPFSQEDLFTTIEVIRNKKEINYNIRLNTGIEVVNVPANEISIVKSDNNYIEVHVNQKKHLVRSSLETFLKENENSNFVRIHRSYVVNLQKINSFSKQHVIIGDFKCPISRSYKEELFHRFA